MADYKPCSGYRTFEQTRHTYDSVLLADCERPYYISKQMGHANLHVTLSRYAKFIPSEDDGKVLSKVTEKLHRLVFAENDGDGNNSESFII